MGRRATPVRHKWHLRLSLNGPRGGDGGDGFERHRKEEEGREERRGEEDEYAACPAALAAVECSACTHLGRGGDREEGGRERGGFSCRQITSTEY